MGLFDEQHHTERLSSFSSVLNIAWLSLNVHSSSASFG